MSTAKAKINLKDGLIELEGSEDFVSKHLEHFRDLVEAYKKTSKVNDDLGDTSNQDGVKPETLKITLPKVAGNGKPVKSSPKKPANSKLPKQLFDLNLMPKGGLSLRDFYNSFVVKTFFEKNLIYVYYLSHHLKVEQITLDHIYTCYKQTGQKVPDLPSSLNDTRRHKGWINYSTLDEITLTIQGENFILHDALKSEEKEANA